MPRLVNTGYYQSRNYYSENMTPRRCVEHFELELVETGTGFSFINGVSYPHLPNRLILAKPGQFRFTVGAFSCWFVRFRCADTEEATLLRALPDTALAEGDLQKNMIEELGGMRVQSIASHFSLQAALCALLREATAYFQPDQPVRGDSDPHFPAVIAVKEYLDSHFSEKIRLDRLADQVHLSKNFFRSKFYQLMGLSPQEYLAQVRLAHARRLLRTTAQPLVDIAVSCGYDSQSYFNYVFKRLTGQTPLAYRRAAHKDGPS